MYRVRHLAPLVVLIFALLSSAFAATNNKPDKKPSEEKKLASEIDKVLSDPEAARGFWGIYAVSIDTGKPLYAFNQELRTCSPSSSLFCIDSSLTAKPLVPCTSTPKRSRRRAEGIKNGAAPLSIGRSDGYDGNESLETAEVVRVPCVDRKALSAGRGGDQEIQCPSSPRLASCGDLGREDPPIGASRVSVEGEGVENRFRPL